LERQRAGLIRLVGDEASSLERLMVESRAVVRNAASVHGHVRLAVALDGSSVSLHRPQKVRLHSEEGESCGVVHVADTVETWLKLWMGDHSYTVIGPAQVRGTR
jgi:hypothetical protein